MPEPGYDIRIDTPRKMGKVKTNLMTEPHPAAYGRGYTLGRKAGYNEGFSKGKEAGERDVLARLKSKRGALMAKLEGLARNTAKTEAELTALNSAIDLITPSTPR